MTEKNCSQYGLYDEPQPVLAHSDTVYLVLFLLYVVYVVGTYIWFLVIREKTMRLRKRSRILLSLSSISGIAGMGIICIRQYLGRDVFSCRVYLAIVLLILPFVGGPPFIRLILFYIETKQLRRRAAKQTDEQPLIGHSKSGRKTGTGKNTRSDSVDSNEEALTKATGLYFAKYSFSASNPIVSVGLTALVMPFIIVAISLVFTLPGYKEDCFGCDLGVAEVIALMLAGGIVLICIELATYKIWKYDDPLGFKQEVLLGFGISTLFCTLGWILILVDPGNLQKNGQIDWNFGMVLAIVAMHTIQCPFQCILSIRQIKKGNSVDSVRLEDILDNKETHALFKKYMVTEFAIDSVIFIENYKAWRSQFGSMPDGYLASEAESIYLKFFGSRATLPLNISVHNSKELAAVFDGESKRRSRAVKVPQTVFDSVYAELIQLLESDSMPRFMSKFGPQVKAILLTMGTSEGKKFKKSTKPTRTTNTDKNQKKDSFTQLNPTMEESKPSTKADVVPISTLNEDVEAPQEEEP